MSDILASSKGSLFKGSMSGPQHSVARIIPLARVARDNATPNEPKNKTGPGLLDSYASLY